MTPKISLVLGIATAVLAVGVPTAFAEGRLAGSLEQGAAVAPDWFERAAAASQAGASVVTRPDSHEIVRPFPTTYVDAAERTQLASRGAVFVYRDASERTGSGQSDKVSPLDYRDQFERAAPPKGSLPVSTPSSGGEVEWPQIGIGFGMGLLLMLGLYLAVRSTRERPLAH